MNSSLIVNGNCSRTSPDQLFFSPARSRKRWNCASSSLRRPRSKSDLEIKAGYTFRSAEQLVNRRPELQLVVAGQRILRSESALALELRREIRREAPRHDAEVERPRRVQADKVARPRVVQRLDRAEPGDARTGEAQFGVASMHRHRRVAILQCVHHQAELPAIDTALQRIHRRRFGAVDVILDRIDLRQRRKAAQFDALPVRHDRGRGEGVIEQAAVRAARLDRSGGRVGEVAKAGIGAIDAREWLAELAPQVRRGDVEFAAGRVHEHLPPPERRQTPARVGDAVDQGRSRRLRTRRTSVPPQRRRCSAPRI